jgi:Flp pilus assembly pilin Flp
MKSLMSFMRDEMGQDMVEYSLILAFVALAGAALFTGMKNSINSIWSSANSKLTEAAS